MTSSAATMVLAAKRAATIILEFFGHILLSNSSKQLRKNESYGYAMCWSLHIAVLLCVRHEPANEIGDFIGGGIQGKVPRVKDVNMGLRNITAVRLGLRQL